MDMIVLRKLTEKRFTPDLYLIINYWIWRLDRNYWSSFNVVVSTEMVDWFSKVAKTFFYFHFGLLMGKSHIDQDYLPTNNLITCNHREWRNTACWFKCWKNIILRRDPVELWDICCNNCCLTLRASLTYLPNFKDRDSKYWKLK